MDSTKHSNSGHKASFPQPDESLNSSFPRRRDKFVWNEFGRPKVGPKGRIQGSILQPGPSSNRGLPDNRASEQDKHNQFLSNKKNSTSTLFIAFLILLVWLPIPLGSNRPWAWALMEVWVYIIAAAWLFKYARGRVTLTEPFRQARAALILFTLWLGYGILQMIPLPESVVAVLSPNTASLYQQAYIGPVLANQNLAPNPIARALPVFTDDRSGTQLRTNRNDATTGAPTDDLPVFKLPATTSTHSVRLTLDLSASLTSWLKSLAYVLIFGLALLLVDSMKRLKTLAYIIVLSGLAQAVYGSLSLAIDGGGVANGSFINRNHFAAYLVLGLSIGIGLLVASMGEGTRVIAWRQRLRHIGALLLSSKAPLRIFLAIMVIALVLTHSRMGNTSFFASMLIAGTLALVQFRSMPRPVIVLIASLIVIDIFIIGSWVGLDQVRDRLVETTLQQETRDEVGRHSLRLWQDYPLFGSGAGSYQGVFPRYRQADDGKGIYEHAHNDYLEFLSEYGIIGIVFPAGVVIVALLNAVNAQRKRRNQFARGIGFAATMAITAMLIHATVEFNLQIPAYAATFMVLLATAWLARYLKSANGPQLDPT